MNPIGDYLTSWFLIPLSVLSILSVRGLNMVSHYLQRIECGYPRRLTSVTTSQIPHKNFVKLQKQMQSSENYTCGFLRCKGGYKECMNIGFPSSNENIQGDVKRKSLGEPVSVKCLCILPSETKCSLLLLRRRVVTAQKCLLARMHFS